MLSCLCIALSLLLAPDVTLDNGIRISPQPADASAFTLVLGYRAGIRNETHSFSGMAAIVSRFLQSTTAARSLALTAYGAGGTVEFLEDPDRTAIRVSVPLWAAPMVLSSAAGFFADTPDKNSDLVDRARVLTLAKSSDGPADFHAKAEDEIRLELLGSHPYTHPADGWKADLEQISDDDVIRFFNENYGTDRAFVLLASSVPEDLRDALAAVRTRKSRPLPEFSRRVLNAERTLHFPPNGSAGAAIFAAPVPGVYYREWYATLMLDRIIRRTLREKPATALPLTMDPYYWRVEVPVATGQQADTVEDNLLQSINRLQFARSKPEDVEAARQDATTYLESAYVREWFASEALEDRRKEGLQWIKSFTADDIRSTVRDLIASNRVVASWAPQPKQSTVQVERLSASTSTGSSSDRQVPAMNPVPVVAFPPHPSPAKVYSPPERLSSGVWLAASSVFGIFLSGTGTAVLPEGAQRLGPNGALWLFNTIPADEVVRAFQKYRAERLLVLAPASSLDATRKMWSTFKSNDGDATVITPQGNVANIDIPALVVLKSMLDRKLIESGWWHEASLHIDATVGATLVIEAPATIRAEIMKWIKTIAAAPAPQADFTWAREAAINHLNEVLPDVQILVWQRVHDYLLPDLVSVASTQVQDVAKLYF